MADSRFAWKVNSAQSMPRISSAQEPAASAIPLTGLWSALDVHKLVHTLPRFSTFCRAMLRARFEFLCFRQLSSKDENVLSVWRNHGTTGARKPIAVETSGTRPDRCYLGRG